MSAPPAPDAPDAPETPRSADLAAAKRALRAEMRAVRAGIAADAASRSARSARIWARIVSSTGLGASGPISGTRRAPIARVLLFASLPSEPDASGWAAWCRQRGIDVYLPAVDGPDLRVEPGGLDPARLDLVVVPGLAFTADGRRLGQGGGHYDRFLRRLRPDCVTIGACFAEQLVAALPIEPHDVAVHAVASDSGEAPPAT